MCITHSSITSSEFSALSWPHALQFLHCTDLGGFGAPGVQKPPVATRLRCNARQRPGGWDKSGLMRTSRTRLCFAVAAVFYSGSVPPTRRSRRRRSRNRRDAHERSLGLAFLPVLASYVSCRSSSSGSQRCVLVGHAQRFATINAEAAVEAQKTYCRLHLQCKAHTFARTCLCNASV